MLRELRRLRRGGLPPGLAGLLTPDEQEALLARAQALVDEACFPEDASGMQYPWPLV
jgi:hypothetical protein